MRLLSTLVTVVLALLLVSADGPVPWAELAERLLAGLCGLIGAGLTFGADPPEKTQGAFLRLGVGFGAGFLFGPDVCQLALGKGYPTSRFAGAGLVGLSSWYLVAALVKLLKWVRDSDLLRWLAVRWAQAQVPPASPPPPPATLPPAQPPPPPAG